MSKVRYLYGVISTDGCHHYEDPIAALQHAAFMEQVGADSVYYLCAEYDAEVVRIKRLSVYDIKKAARLEGKVRDLFTEQQKIR